MKDRAPGRSPVRTCIGCRSRAVKSELLRVVAGGAGAPGALVPDHDGRLPGRGAYLHPNPECLDQAERRRAFSRALRREGPLDVTELRRRLAGQEDRSGRPKRPAGQAEGDTT
ncbi:YlxR family protein [Jiangella asiatica]|uniref:YlxR family protein n=1 Tax=Jiangella asiatica TaxID=2530372 RepID=A0A4R5DKZ1_9ACTN|nr:YlxR family protein [Jiangella asiatica]TDE14077.1 YlxR family protein [Jiangella asiatica]